MAPLDVGFYGKLPSHGDFLRRRVSDAFVQVWDEWLQGCLLASRASLGDRWLDLYLTSPAWRFACAAGTFGPEPVVGLMVPSVDRVGRYFHLTVVAELPSLVSLLPAAVALSAFFERAEQLVIETLGAESVDFDRFDSCVLNLSDDLRALDDPPRISLDASASASLLEGGRARWQVPLRSASALPAMFADLLAQPLSSHYDPLVLMWTDGSASVEPVCLIGKGLPAPSSFGALLDGSWAAHDWPSVDTSGGTGDKTAEHLVEDGGSVRFRSAGASDVGCVRTVNQDSRLERTEIGLWAVADGMGGHSEGEVASRMVCDSLADFLPDGSFEHLIQAADHRLHEVNDYLVRRAMRSSNAVVSGSTVVVLLARRDNCAVLWAGDSRVYRLRGGRLEQLTHDHSLVAESEGLTSAASNVVTRAIGGDADLALDLFRDRVLAGDRFLLCSDGLTRFVADTQIQQWLEHDSIEAAVEGLIDATLVAGAPDNVTAVVVEAY